MATRTLLSVDDSCMRQGSGHTYVMFRYWPGGFASGFSHVDHTVKPRLIHVKGKHCPRMREVSAAVSESRAVCERCFVMMKQDRMKLDDVCVQL